MLGRLMQRLKMRQMRRLRTKAGLMGGGSGGRFRGLAARIRRNRALAMQRTRARAEAATPTKPTKPTGTTQEGRRKRSDGSTKT